MGGGGWFGSAVEALRAFKRELLTVFGTFPIVQPQARIQISANYGIIDTEHTALTAGTGSTSASRSVFTVATSTGVFDYAVIRSRRRVQYQPGQESRFLITARWPLPGVADSLLVAGAFTATDALLIGYLGTEFGVFQRIAGAAAIWRLTISAGTGGGAENITVTLNGVEFTFSLGSGLSTSATAEGVAEATTYTGWTAEGSPSSNGATVTFIQSQPATTGADFTFESDGSATGTFAEVQAGAANGDGSSALNAFIAEADFSPGFPSWYTHDPTKLNIYRISYGFLGGAGTEYAIKLAGGEFHTFHRIARENAYITPNQVNPTYRMGWIAASLGSTTALSVEGCSAAGFVMGAGASSGEPFGKGGTLAAGTTEYVALVIRCRAEFGGTVNQRDLQLKAVSCGLESASRVGTVRILRNPTLTGTVDWAYVDQTRSAAEYAEGVSITPTGGVEAAVFVATASGTAPELEELEIQLTTGETLAVAVKLASGSSNAVASLSWLEV